MAKNTISSFDFEAAFKALDEIEIPKVGGVIPNRANLHETLKRVSKTDMLVEEYYDLESQDDLEQAADDREGEVAKAKLARIEKIVDLDATTEDDLLTSYVGKTVIQCPQCMTLFYKNPEDIVPDEADEMNVNVGEVCQHCGNDSGYTLIGKVAEADKPEAAEEELPEEIPAEDTETEEIPEEDSGEIEESEPESEGLPDEIPEEEVEESLSKEAQQTLNEEVETTETGAATSDEQEESQPENCEDCNEALTEAANAGPDVEGELTDSAESNKDSAIEDVVECCDIKLEAIEDVAEDELAETLTESLTNVYENVEGFKLTGCSVDDKSLVLEGLITFKSGSTRKASYIITEAKAKGENATLYGKCEDLNMSLAVRGSLKESVFTAHRVAYKYNINDKLVEGFTRNLLLEKTPFQSIKDLFTGGNSSLAMVMGTLGYDSLRIVPYLSYGIPSQANPANKVNGWRSEVAQISGDSAEQNTFSKIVTVDNKGKAKVNRDMSYKEVVKRAKALAKVADPKVGLVDIVLFNSRDNSNSVAKNGVYKDALVIACADSSRGGDLTTVEASVNAKLGKSSADPFNEIIKLLNDKTQSDVHKNRLKDSSVDAVAAANGSDAAVAAGEKQAAAAVPANEDAGFTKTDTDIEAILAQLKDKVFTKVEEAVNNSSLKGKAVWFARKALKADTIPTSGGADTPTAAFEAALSDITADITGLKFGEKTIYRIVATPEDDKTVQASTILVIIAQKAEKADDTTVTANVYADRLLKNYPAAAAIGGDSADEFDTDL